MSLMQNFNETSLAQSIRGNRRLQWMLFAVLVILSLSTGKAALDQLDEPLSETERQLQLLARLESSKDQTVDPNLLSEAKKKLESLLNVTPVATSLSTAEAKALTDIEALVGVHINNKRMNLLGTEEINTGQHTLWTVRVDVSGMVKKHSLLPILENFDKQLSNLRLASLQYSPKTSDSITMVVDLLYREDKQ